MTPGKIREINILNYVAFLKFIFLLSGWGMGCKLDI